VVDLKFTARWGGYQMFIRDEQREYFPDGRSRLLKPSLVADFGEQALAVETYDGTVDEDLGGGTYVSPRGGGYLDTELAQKDNGWTDEEREFVEARLLEAAENGPNAGEYRTMPPHLRPPSFGDVKLYEEPVPVAPWPTYDKIHHNLVASKAHELGLSGAALAYETRTKNRPSVVEKLQEFAALEQAENELTAA
jgi:hypothetical protein